MTKEQFIKSLSKVKLIIGNGFDLHCNIPTSYKNYFLHDAYKNDSLNAWINKFLPQLDDFVDFNKGNYRDFWAPFEHFDKVNIWDLFFYINSDFHYGKTKEYRWCDIEDKICSWLKDRTPSAFDNGKPQWEIVYNIINNYNKSDNERVKLMAAFIFKKHNEKRFDNINDFYMFLLCELRLFERNFGLYIDKLHYDRTNEAFGVVLQKTRFSFLARLTIEKLCNLNNLVSIDSFNYDDLENKELNEKLANINGTVDAPIFGIDSNIFPASDIRYIFSKTNRRMDLDMLSDEKKNDESFENLVIYGHSLNEADYSYFFSIFDKLKISDLTNDSKIVFAFSIYDENQEEQIRSKLRSSIAKMFFDYSIYLGKDKQPNRLLDILTSQGKILMYQIN